MIGVLRNTYGIFRNFVECHRTRSLSLILFVQNIVHTLDEKRIELGDFLSTDPKRKLGRGCITRFKEAGVTVIGSSDVGSFYPDVTE
jgi:hypothetical protein